MVQHARPVRSLTSGEPIVRYVAIAAAGKAALNRSSRFVSTSVTTSSAGEIHTGCESCTAYVRYRMHNGTKPRSLDALSKQFVRDDAWRAGLRFWQNQYLAASFRALSVEFFGLPVHNSVMSAASAMQIEGEEESAAGDGCPAPCRPRRLSALSLCPSSKYTGASFRPCEIVPSTSHPRMQKIPAAVELCSQHPRP